MVCSSLPGHIHFIGALGRGMGAVVEAVASTGVRITGSDRSTAYGPLRERLQEIGVDVALGFDPAHLQPSPDLVVIGRAFGRGNPEVEAVLSRRIPYLSLSAFLCSHFLSGSRNLLVAGSKGKTTTTTMLVQILSGVGLNPGYLIGGRPKSGMPSARLGGPLHILEADEYSSLWWDGNAKFLDYRPETLILTNIYKDHPDLFPEPDLCLVQYRALISQLPSTGLLVVGDSRLSLGMERLLEEAPCRVEVVDAEETAPEQHWNLEPTPGGVQFRWRETDFELAIPGAMNARNAVCATLAAEAVGITTEQAAAALNGFAGVQGRLESIASRAGQAAYLDCFGYLPASLARNLEALRGQHPGRRLILIYQLILVDQMPAIREELLAVLRRWDAVVLVDEAPVASLTPKPCTAFLRGLVDDLVSCGHSAHGPLPLAECFGPLGAVPAESEMTLFCSMHPSQAEPATRLVSAWLGG